MDELLCSNADYLVDSLSRRLRHPDRHPRAPTVLRVLLSYSGAQVLPLVEDTVQEVGHVFMLTAVTLGYAST